MDAPSDPQEGPEAKDVGDYSRLSSVQISDSGTDVKSEVDHIYAMSDNIQISPQTIASLKEVNRLNINTQNSALEDISTGKNNSGVTSRPLPPVTVKTTAPNGLTPLEIPLYYNYLTESSTDPPNEQEYKESRRHISEDRQLPVIPNNIVRARNMAHFSGNLRNLDSSRNHLNDPSNKSTTEVEQQGVQNLRQRYQNCLIFLFIFVLMSMVIVGSTLGGVILVGYRIQDRIQVTFSEASDNMATMLEESHKNLTKKVNSLCRPNPELSDVKIIFSGSCYCLYRRKLSWFQAREYCLSLGSEVHLAEIYDTTTNDLLLPIFQHSSLNDGVWLGASNLVERENWVWNYTGRSFEKSKTYPWEKFQPSGLSHRFVPEHCLEVYNWAGGKYMWNDRVCEDKLPFTCMSAYENSKCYC